MNRKNSIYRDIHVFVQDTWKPNGNLTLDYGVRLLPHADEHNRDPDETLDAVFLPSKWDPAKAPRYYVPIREHRADHRSGDPEYAAARPNVANVLRYTIVPGSAIR